MVRLLDSPVFSDKDDKPKVLVTAEEIFCDLFFS